MSTLTDRQLLKLIAIFMPSVKDAFIETFSASNKDALLNAIALTPDDLLDAILDDDRLMEIDLLMARYCPEDKPVSDRSIAEILEWWTTLVQALLGKYASNSDVPESSI